MIVLDVNVLIYAHNQRAQLHDANRAWLQRTLGGPRAVGLPLITALGFVRIVTNPRAVVPPVPVADALRMLAVVRGAPAVVEVAPAEGHWDRVADLAAEAQLSGAAMTDVHLAALALERGAVLATHDRGFRRFGGLEIIEPGAAS